MQSVSWITCAISSAISRSIVHFFPSAQITSAPYPVVFKLSIFGKDIQPKYVALEGGRLGQPDGVRLEDAFPQLAEGVSGLIGLKIEVTTPQPRIDLSPSQCVMEIISSAQSVRFNLRQVGQTEKRSNAPQPQKSVPIVAGINDAFFLSSLALVNAGDQPYTPLVLSTRKNADTLEPLEIKFDAVAANTVQELVFNEAVFTDTLPQECSWGLVRGRAFQVSSAIPDSVRCFAIYRDTLTKRIIGVAQL